MQSEETGDRGHTQPAEARSVLEQQQEEKNRGHRRNNDEDERSIQPGLLNMNGAFYVSVSLRECPCLDENVLTLVILRDCERA